MKTAHNQELKKFINRHSDLFWYMPEDKKENVSLEFLLETILNYGSLESIKKIIELIGIEKAHEVFMKQTGNERSNYFPPVKNFFELYFKRHA